MTKKLHLAFLTAIATLTVAVPAVFAHGPGQPGPGATGMGAGPGMMGQGPMGPGMMGPGMMGQGPMGPGMMGPGMMGPGMMGRGMGGQGRMGARMGPGMMGGCGGMMMAGSPSARIAGRLAYLRVELGITDSQKDAFDAYADAIKSSAGQLPSMWQQMNKMMSAETPVERLNIRLSMMEARVEALKSVKPKLEALYATFSDEQKQKANEAMIGMGCMM